MNEKKNKTLLIVLGILMVICGVMVLGAPFVMGAVVLTLIGAMLIVGGIAEMVAAFFAGGLKKGALLFCAGILSVIAGGVVLNQPMFSSSVFTFMIAGYFFADGITRVVQALKADKATGWGIFLLSGILSIILAILLLANWPFSGLQMIGIIVGVRLLMSGISALSLAFAAGTVEGALTE